MSLRRRRMMSVLWVLGVLAAISLTGWGLSMMFLLFGYPDAFQREKSGHTLIFLGAVASAGSAVWARLRGQGWPVTYAVAAPALLVGLPDLADSHGLVMFMGSIIALPAAFAGLLYGLLNGRTEENSHDQPGNFGPG